MAVVLQETDYGTKEKLRLASQRTAKRIKEEFADEIKEWWEKVYETAIGLCPKGQTLKLVSSIQLVEGVPDVTPYYGVSAGMEGTDADVSDWSITAGGETGTGEMCNYAEAVHDGHRTRSGSWVPEQPFLTTAIDMNESELIDILSRIAQIAEDEFNKD